MCSPGWPNHPRMLLRSQDFKTKPALVPGFVAGDGAQDRVDAARLRQAPLVGAAALHQNGQQLADVLLVAVHLRVFLLRCRVDDAQDPAQELRGRNPEIGRLTERSTGCSTKQLTASRPRCVKGDGCITGC